MDKAEFTERIAGLMPDFDQEAMNQWQEYAGFIEEDELITASDYFDAVYVEFSLVCEHYSTKLATELFSIGRFCTLNQFEVRGAANYLADGHSLKEIEKLALDGMCDSSKEEAEQFKAGLAALQQEKAAGSTEKPSIIAQLKKLFGKENIPGENQPGHKKSGPEL